MMITASPQAASAAAFLQGRSVPCPNCGYDLRDSVGDRCPECGLPLRLQLVPSASALPALIVGTVVISAALGFSLLLWIVMIIAYFVEVANGPTAYRVHTVLGGGVLIATVCLAGWVRSRLRLQRASPVGRWLLVVACLLIPLLNVGGFAVLIFLVGL